MARHSFEHSFLHAVYEACYYLLMIDCWSFWFSVSGTMLNFPSLVAILASKVLIPDFSFIPLNTDTSPYKYVCIVHSYFLVLEEFW